MAVCETQFFFSSGSDDDDQPEDDADVGLWMNILGEDEGPRTFPFTAAPGPMHVPRADSSPLDFAKTFISDELVNLLVLETNRYADQWIESQRDYLTQKPYSRVHIWIKIGHTTLEEMWAFLAIVINIGLVRKPTLFSYWDSVNPSQSTSWFIKHFNRDRFFLLLKFLHFADNQDQPPQNDPAHKTYKIKPVVDYFNRKFKRHYKPSEDISIDESMVGYKGRTPHLRQYMPNKHHARFGIKLWCLCDSRSSYTVRVEVYKGVEEVRNEEGATYALVMRLIEGANLLHSGYHLGLDNYFSSPKLAIDLFGAHTTCTGTVRKNRKGLSPTVKSASLRNKEVCERRKGNLLAVAYKDGSKRPILISTKAKAGFSDVTNSKGKQRNVPNIVALYNASMGGVDMSDARLYSYLSDRRTMKWTSKVFFSLLGRGLLNSYIIYSETTSDRPVKTRYQYMVSVVEGMVGDYQPPAKIVKKRRSKTEIAAARLTPTQVAPPAPDQFVQPAVPLCTLSKLPVSKKRNCLNNHTSRVRSGWECKVCDVGLCPTCFAPYHRAKRPRQQ